MYKTLLIATTFLTYSAQAATTTHGYNTGFGPQTLNFAPSMVNADGSVNIDNFKALNPKMKKGHEPYAFKKASELAAQYSQQQQTAAAAAAEAQRQREIAELQRQIQEKQAALPKSRAVFSRGKKSAKIDEIADLQAELANLQVRVDPSVVQEGQTFPAAAPSEASERLFTDSNTASSTQSQRSTTPVDSGVASPVKQPEGCVPVAVVNQLLDTKGNDERIADLEQQNEALLAQLEAVKQEKSALASANTSPVASPTKKSSRFSGLFKRGSKNKSQPADSTRASSPSLGSLSDASNPGL